MSLNRGLLGCDAV